MGMSRLARFLPVILMSIDFPFEMLVAMTLADYS